MLLWLLHLLWFLRGGGTVRSRARLIVVEIPLNPLFGGDSTYYPGDVMDMAQELGHNYRPGLASAPSFRFPSDHVPPSVEGDPEDAFLGAALMDRVGSCESGSKKAVQLLGSCWPKPMHDGDFNPTATWARFLDDQNIIVEGGLPTIRGLSLGFLNVVTAWVTVLLPGPFVVMMFPLRYWRIAAASDLT